MGKTEYGNSKRRPLSRGWLLSLRTLLLTALGSGVLVGGLRCKVQMPLNVFLLFDNTNVAHRSQIKYNVNLRDLTAYLQKAFTVPDVPKPRFGIARYNKRPTRTDSSDKCFDLISNLTSDVTRLNHKIESDFSNRQLGSESGSQEALNAITFVADHTGFTNEPPGLGVNILVLVADSAPDVGFSQRIDVRYEPPSGIPSLTCPVDTSRTKLTGTRYAGERLRNKAINVLHKYKKVRPSLGYENRWEDVLSEMELPEFMMISYDITSSQGEVQMARKYETDISNFFCIIQERILKERKKEESDSDSSDSSDDDDDDDSPIPKPKPKPKPEPEPEAEPEPETEGEAQSDVPPKPPHKGDEGGRSDDSAGNSGSKEVPDNGDQSASGGSTEKMKGSDGKDAEKASGEIGTRTPGRRGNVIGAAVAGVVLALGGGAAYWRWSRSPQIQYTEETFRDDPGRTHRAEIEQQQSVDTF